MRNQYSFNNRFTTGLLALIIGLFSFNSQATIVQFITPVGNFEVNLYDQTTPKTVANFLEYVRANDYDNSVVHRSVSSFIIQGGGFNYDQNWPLGTVNTNATVDNEPVYSNVRGTIAMAKLASDPNSATNQWFINLDNNIDLDRQNSGFTVFGEVIGDGMNVVDEIAALPKYNFGGALAELPLRNYQAGNPDDTHLVLFSSIAVIDETTDTAANLNPPLNVGPLPEPEPISLGGGGVFGGVTIALLGLFVLLIGRKNTA